MELQGFTLREKEVVGAVMQAYSIKEIAIDLQLSTNTIKDYLKTVYRKARVHSARELMAKIQRDPPVVEIQNDTALLLDELEELMEGDGGRGVEKAVRRCTGAGNAGLWRMAANRDGLRLLPPDRAGGRHPIGGSSLLGLLEPKGIWLHRVKLDTDQCGALSRAGLNGDVIAVACAEPWAGQVLLASDPPGGSFQPIDLQTLRVLASVAAVVATVAGETTR